MKKTKQQLEKITKYSIRKLTVGVGPVAIGAFLFGASTFSVDKVQANEVGGAHNVHYRYLAEQELTESEKALIHHEVPTEFQDDDILYVVYRKKATNSQQLPYTGSKELALAGLGLATASLAVFLVSKKGRKEVLGVLLIGSLGASTFVPYGTFAFENKELLSYNQTISASTHEGLAEGIIHIDGYEYIGYFKEAELHPSRPASAEKSQLSVEKQSSKEIEKTEVVQERPAVTPETVIEKPVVENPVAPAVEEKPVSEKPQVRQEESLVEIPFETVTSPDANLAEGQTRIVTAGVNGQRRLVTKVSMVNGQEVREVIEDQVVQNPVSQVIAVGTKKEVQPSPTPVPTHQVAKGTQEEGKEGQALTQPELPEAVVESKGTQEEGKEGQALTQPELPEAPVEAKGTQEAGKEGQALTQPELPEYHEAKGTQEVKEGEKQGEALVQPETPAYTGEITAKGTQEAGHEGESLVQPELPEYEVTEATVTETETVEVTYTREYVTDDTRYTDEETVIQNGQAGSQLIHRVYKTVNGQKVGDPISTSTETVKAAVNEKISRGTKAIEGQVEEVSFEEIPFETRTEVDSTLPKGTEVVAQAGQNGKKKITKVYKTLKGVKTADAPTISEEVVESAQDRLIKKGEQVPAAPTLTLTQIDKEELERSAKVRYRLVKPTGVTIKSLEVVLKDGDTSLQTVNMSEGDLIANLTDLKYYKDYKIATKMVYDRGNGNEEVVLTEEPLRIDLKKIEIKDIKETRLMKVDGDGNETDSSLLETVPENITSYYLKITTNNNKVTKLAITNIEEVIEDETSLFKVTASAPDLIQRDSNNRLSQTYTYYIEKPKASQNNVYYNFKDLVNAMQKNPNGEFKLGKSLDAEYLDVSSKSYITGNFKGTLSSDGDKHYAIYNLKKPLFHLIDNGKVQNINFENVNINLPSEDNVSVISHKIQGEQSLIKDVKVTGNITGRNHVAGFVNWIEHASRLENVAFIGNIHTTGNGGNSYMGGIAGRMYEGIIDRAYVDATLTGNRVRVGGIIAVMEHRINGAGRDRFTKLRKSVMKGMINLSNPIEAGGLISKNWPWGNADNNVSYANVVKGEILYGSPDINDSDFAFPYVKNNYSVLGVSAGSKSYTLSHNLKEISKEDADKRVASYGITANLFDSEKLQTNTLNNIETKDKEYKLIQNYKSEYDQAYRNIAKLQPFYNKDWIVHQGNKLEEDSNLVKKEVLSVIGMKNGQFITDLSDIDKIMIHYSDGTKDEMSVAVNSDSGVAQVKEYDIVGQNIVYTPNMVVKNRSDLMTKVKEILTSVELESAGVRSILDRRNDSKDKNANTEQRQNGYIRDFYFEEHFQELKANMDTIVKHLVESEDHQLSISDATQRALVKKIQENSAKIMLGLAYLNRYYGINFDGKNIKDLMMFKPDFYGKNVDVLDRLIEIGSKENNLRGHRTHDAFREVLAKNTVSGNLIDFLRYNMKLLTADTDLNDWFIHSTDGKVYVVEKQSREEGLKNAKYRAFDNLSKGYHQKMILPLLNLKQTQAFLISTYNTISFGTANKYNTTLGNFKDKIDLAANRHLNYLDFWYRLANENVKNLLAKEIVTPVWEGYQVWGHDWGKWMDKYGKFEDGKGIYAPTRELYGPVGEHYGPNGAVAGAYATYYDDKNDNRAKVVFVMSDMISEYGSSAFTHETTHINDRVVYYGGYTHREGTFLEAFAQGMLQSPATQGHQGEYGALGLNMAFERENDGNQWYNYNPNNLKSRKEIDHYMKNYNEALMMLDYLEADAVIGKLNGDNSKWFKKVDKKMRHTDGDNKHLVGPNQWDEVRDLSEQEKALELNNINDLVNNNFITKHGAPGNGVYRPEDFRSAYVNVNMMTGIYGGNTSDGAPGALSFKHNAFRMWGYFGYENGFIGYVSNKYKGEAKKDGENNLSDKFIIKKVSKNVYNTLEDWKQHWFQEIKDKANNGFTAIEINGETITSYDRLKTLFSTAVEKDLAELNDSKVERKYRNTVGLKEKVFKQLLYKSDGFSGNLFNESQA
ncbi:ZmpA/ZmpB/ZmpC family metallo-endopeptidase [Streptococcus pneumoniae]|uniref:ZmpA/ZmpB/ZmpC family metallo-endopeptidase n=1 Tax=Streptococcus pseudopneumoniae TaxID=257758 RepID=UPI003128851C